MENIQNMQYGKMFSEPSVQIKDKTSSKSSKNSQKPKFLYLDLTRTEKSRGQIPEWSEQTTERFPSEHLIVSIGESPSVVKESFLSSVLENDVPEKYFLSSKACQGILRRAEKRGKKLPEVLEMALKQQAGLTVLQTESPEQSLVSGQRVQEDRQGMNIITLSVNQSFLNHEVRTECQESMKAESAQLLTQHRGGQRQPCIAQPIAFNGRQDPVSGHVTGAIDTDRATQCIAYPDPANGESIPTRYAVRRLMPIEAERLQSFPDNWTNIPGASDTARYKAIGNSLVCNIVDWIFSQIVNLEKETSNAK